MSSISSSSSIEQVEAYLTNVLSSLPIETRFADFSNRIASSIAPDNHPSAQPLLATAGGLAGLSILILIAGFITRVWKGNFWLVRIVKFQNEKYLLFNYVLCWGVGLVALLVGLEGHLWKMYQAETGALLDDLILWILLPWTAGVWQVSVSTWSLATTYILHLRTYTARGRSVWPWFIRSRFINCLGIIIPLVHIATIFPIAFTADHHYRRGLNEYRQIARTLTGADGGSPIESVVSTIAPHFRTLETEFDELHQWFRSTFIAYGAWAGALEVVFLVVALRYIAALRKSLRDFSNKSNSGVVVFQRSLRGLTRISVSFAILMTLLCLNAIWISVLAPKTFSDGVIRELSTVLPIYTVIFASYPAGVLIIHQSFHITPNFSTSSPTSPRTTRLFLPFGRKDSRSTSSPWSHTSPSSSDRPEWAFAARDQLPSLAFLRNFEPDQTEGNARGGRAFEDLELRTAESGGIGGGEGIVVKKLEVTEGSGVSDEEDGKSSW